MPDRVPTIEEIEARLAAMAPPQTPSASVQRDNAELFQVIAWRRMSAVRFIGALLTMPQFHSNHIRLDWLLRLVLSHADGRKEVTRHDLNVAINVGLGKAGLSSMEDPSSELFCEQLVTSKGNFTLLPGNWDEAVAYTQTVLTAFEELPDRDARAKALDSCYALLMLGEALSKRSMLPPMMPGGGEPFSEVELPSHSELRELQKRVVFSKSQLEELGLSMDQLGPFIMKERLFPVVGSFVPGDSPLEFFPLIADGTDLVVASPQSFSTAIRAMLIDTAIRNGMGRALAVNLFSAQEEYSLAGGFWPLREINLSIPDRFGMRGSICQYEPGRYLQVIQINAPFEGFPRQAFGTVRRLSADASERLVQYVEEFWKFAAERDDVRSTMTFVLIGGWGCPFSLAPAIDEAKAPLHWEFASASFAECSVFGVAEDTHFDDVARVLKQMRLLEGEGFSFLNSGGLINLLGYWRSTDGNFIPEHMVDIVPPIQLLILTDEELKLREQAAKRRGFQSLAYPGEPNKTVQRLNWGDGEVLEPIYACTADIGRDLLSGCVVWAGRIWWLDAPPMEGDSRDWRYQVWNAAIHWLDVGSRAVLARWPESFPEGVRRASLTAEGGFRYTRILPAEFGTGNLAASVTSVADEMGGTVTLGKEWIFHLGVAENTAELELIAAVLEVLSVRTASPLTRAEIKEAVLAEAGSADWRWLHAREAITVQDRIGGRGLVGNFRQISFSAHCLAKCGSIWAFRDRASGSVIAGDADCQTFLAEYQTSVMQGLIEDIHRFDRRALTAECLSHYQAARVEQGRWKTTIKALRAIDGSGAYETAFKRQNEVNGVQRAAKVIAEIAACEATVEGGLMPGDSEIDDLFAKLLLVFGNGQLSISMRAGLIKPELKISPAGDLLSEREQLSSLLRPTAEWLSRKSLDHGASEYAQPRKRDENPPERLSWDSDLRAAVEAEYQTTAEGFVNLQFGLAHIAERRGEGVFTIRRSDLIAALTADETLLDKQFDKHIDRLTLPSRTAWDDLAGHHSHDFDVRKFDRPWSLINRPILALDASDDPQLVVAPILVADSTMYCFGGLMDGALNNDFWVSKDARQFAGKRGDIVGAEFETELAEKITASGLEATPRYKISTLLNEKVPPELGDVDVVAVSADRRRVWIIEAKNLKLCRTETEIAARLTEYRGQVITKESGKTKPDKLLRHLRRVAYIRDRREALQKALRLPQLPDVRGIVIVDCPQPMSIHAISTSEDAHTIMVDEIGDFEF
jgi:hypothetical protein